MRAFSRHRQNCISCRIACYCLLPQ